MNITDSNNITQLIKSFKQSRSLPQYKKAIPPSYDKFFFMSANKQIFLSTFWRILSEIPNYIFPKSKQKTCIKKSFNIPGIIFSNRTHEHIVDTDTTTGSDVLIGYVNLDNDYKDISAQGGGLKSKYIADQDGNNMWIGSYLDIGRLDGTPTQIGPTIIVELPKDILDTYTQDDINAAVKKYIASGVLPVIRYYDVLDGTIITPQLPTIPDGLQPANGSTELPKSLTLSWNSQENVNFVVQVATDSMFTNVVYENNISQNSTNVNLSDGVEYYWRVRAVNFSGFSDWSVVYDFTTVISMPAKPVLIAPVSGSVKISNSPILNWNSALNADSYNLQVSTQPNFSVLTVNKTGITDTVYHLSGLSGNTEYYWRVSGANISGTSPWSDVSNFATAIYFAPQTSYTSKGTLKGSYLCPIVINTNPYILAINYDTTKKAYSAIFNSYNIEQNVWWTAGGQGTTYINLNQLTGVTFYSDSTNSSVYYFLGFDSSINSTRCLKITIQFAHDTVSGFVLENNPTFGPSLGYYATSTTFGGITYSVGPNNTIIWSAEGSTGMFADLNTLGIAANPVMAIDAIYTGNLMIIESPSTQTPVSSFSTYIIPLYPSIS